MLERILTAVRRRPVRVVEALVVLGAAVGLTVEPEARDAIVTLVAVLVPAVVGGEIAQRRTTPVADPSLPDGHVPGDADPAETR